MPVILFFKRPFDPMMFFFRKGVIYLNNVTFCDYHKQKLITFPEGYYEIKVRLYPHFYSNTLPVTILNEGKTVHVEGVFNRSMLHTFILMLFGLFIFAYISSGFWNVILIPLAITGALSIGRIIYYLIHPEKALKIYYGYELVVYN